MNKKGPHLILGFILLVLIGVGIYFSPSQNGVQVDKSSNNSATTSINLPTKEILYKNTEYGFSFSLPKSWKDYSVIEDEWDGTTEHGPLISIRHPDWEYKSPRQDIPIMVFTIKQWNDIQTDKFHIGAAPINPSEIGRNKKYVFAIPARYNFSYLIGYEEVDRILRSDSFGLF